MSLAGRAASRRDLSARLIPPRLVPTARPFKYGADRAADFRAFAGSLHHAPRGIHTISILNQWARGYRPTHQSGGRSYFVSTQNNGSRGLENTPQHVTHFEGD
jgi:hypothetical protein